MQERQATYLKPLLWSTILNLLLKPMTIFHDIRGKFLQKDFVWLQIVPQKFPLIEIDPLTKNQAKGRLILNAASQCEEKKEKYHRKSGGRGAIDNDKEQASGEEVFVRLSAYEDDRRVDFIRKRLRDGSFTTTKDDYLTCKGYKDDPVDRYALPNDEEIKYAYHVKPISSDNFQRGIVQPAFEHCGGGEEAYFEKGTSDDTLLSLRGNRY